MVKLNAFYTASGISRVNAAELQSYTPPPFGESLSQLLCMNRAAWKFLYLSGT
jgi:hypothetical protein